MAIAKEGLLIGHGELKHTSVCVCIDKQLSAHFELEIINLENSSGFYTGVCVYVDFSDDK